MAYENKIARLHEAIESADAVVVGAGAGLSTAAGFTYSGERFERLFGDTFVEDAGWHAAAERYRDFLEAHADGKVLFLELGVGGNTPVIIKYPFWRYTNANPQATYACVNLGEEYVHQSIADRSVLVDADIDRVLLDLLGKR